MTEEPAWYALVVPHHHEKKTVQSLLKKGLQAIVPTSSVRQQWSDRVKTVQLPIFPGYVFCRFGKQQQLVVLRTASVASVASDNHGYIAISESDIDALNKLSGVDLDIRSHEFVESGDVFVIDQGPLSGMQVFAVDHNGVTKFIKSFHSFKSSCLIPGGAEVPRTR